MRIPSLNRQDWPESDPLLSPTVLNLMHSVSLTNSSVLFILFAYAPSFQVHGHSVSQTHACCRSLRSLLTDLLIIPGKAKK